MINGKTSLPKTAENCKTRWNALRGQYNDYKHLSKLSGAGWSNGCIVLPDEVWEPILHGKDKDSKKSKDYARCKDRPFPLFDDIAPLVEGHQATAKYVKTAILKNQAPPRDRPTTPSTSATKTSSSHPHSLSPDSSESDIPDVQQPLQPISGHDSSSSDHELNRHGKSAVALKQRTPAPARKKKRSGVDIVDGLSTELHDMSSYFKSSISSTSSAVDSTAQAITTATPSVHAQAVTLIYESNLTRPQCFQAVKLFTAEPLMAETYLNTPAGIRDEWVLFEIAS
ncbi:hypothetical protein DFH28DRAFT_947893 [Melampsora americana]|nr:hypothetical protein DFH28DRAFT_947893 [Melampsora americana]